ncbi:formate dehydrogenase accessory sulfurtransferase FdhD [Evansella sp. AB-P1]|uniref:formate dehydrogenase accessory sulfurtransferase FdhD n=1 Tax=Evansella sp. AB-P1 TaxID=3037653 RepID=UPI00241D7AAD|nr:formate dehydrogenase accessory sulfurtransferase FdhD [Evansella sp. AB-P1]MDG5787476.1 formate dehydrogenase accessory sulfurtransferase FdhD [Evansella sp. AB-P1]
MDSNVMRRKKIVKYNEGKLLEIEDYIAVEEPFTIHINGQEFATMLCTPTNLQELAIGFLASEGVIRTVEEICSVTIDQGKGYAYIELENQASFDPTVTSKRIIGSCCGKSRQFYFQNDVKVAKTIINAPKITGKQCGELMEKMESNSAHFKQTGGLHNGGLATVNELLYSYSDIGRHNALDKLYGHCLLNRISTKNKVIVFSGRISSEVLLKVSKMGIGIILAKSAPTTLAIALAEELGITTVGFIRGDRFNIYSRHERIIEDK